MGWACGTYGWGEGVYRVLVGKPDERRPLGRPRCRWVDNIRMDLLEVGCGYMDWIGLAQDRDRWRTLVSAVMNLRVLWNAGNFLTSCKPVRFSRRILHHGVSKYYSSGSHMLLTAEAWFQYQGGGKSCTGKDCFLSTFSVFSYQLPVHLQFQSVLRQTVFWAFWFFSANYQTTIAPYSCH